MWGTFVTFNYEFAVFKIDNTTSKSLNEEEHGQSEESESFQKFIRLMLNIFGKKFVQ